jgi:hypothetical protein
VRDAARPRPAALLNEQGATLVFTMLVLFVLLSLTVASLIATTSDLKISGNYQTGTEALLTAESGILHAQESINEIGVISNCQSEIVSNWGSIFTTSAVTVQGYPLLRYTVAATADSTDPAGHMLLTAVGEAPNESQRSIQARLATGNAFSPGAIYLPGNSVNPNFNGNSFLVDGHDTNLDGSANPSGDAPGISARAQSSVDSVAGALSSQQADNVVGRGGTPSVQLSNGFSASQLLNDIVPRIQSTPGVVTNPQLNGNDTFGTQASPQITHFTGDVNVTGDLSGFGVLLVDGGLTISGSTTFTGLIVVQGTTDITTLQGNTTILGSLWTTDLRLTVGGSASITYSSQALEQVNALGGSSGLLPRRVKVVAWKE